MTPKPPWLKVRAPGGERYTHLKGVFRSLDLHTVCEEAHCPNVGECWSEGTATLMLLGDTCTRGCRFCAVKTGNPRGAVDVREPAQTAIAIAKMELQYVVLTMVDRDDLLDGGAGHVARTIREIRARRPDILIEALVGDFQGHLDYVTTVAEAPPDVYAHNIEVVRRLTRTVRDVRCDYDQSMRVLSHAKTVAGPRVTKSSVMVGMGETHDEVLETLRDLRGAGCDIVTIGQYLRPTPKHHEVVRYVEPAEFDDWAVAARELGFLYVASAPLVRSSYHAAEVFLRSVLQGVEGADVEALLRDRMDTARREARRHGGQSIADAAAHEAASLARAGLVPITALRRH